ncbi:MAG: response regulator [Nitrospinae bacterium]|nr:response regulator [Nitrospinota bacterium]
MPIKLLFADDSVTIQKVVELAFESEDVAVTTVGSGEKAMEKLKESKPDIIIADVVMPGMNGLELCKNVKKDENYSDIPVLLLRSEFDDFDNDVIGRVGAADCITKPFKSEELVKKIKDIAGKRTKNNDLDIVLSELEGSEVESRESEDSGQNTKDMVQIIEEGGMLSLEPDDEITNEAIEDNENISSVEIISPEVSIENEDLNISGLLSGEDIEDVKEKIRKAEEELLQSIADKKDEEITGSFPFGKGKLETAAEGEREILAAAKPSSDINSFMAELEKESVLTEKVRNIVVKTTEDVFEKTFRDFLERTVKNSTEKTIKETTEKLILSLTPQIVKIIENTVWEIVPDLAESLIKKEIEKIKNGIG